MRYGSMVLAVLLAVLSGAARLEAATVATPVLSPSPGTYAGSVRVSMTSATSGAVIRYTTSGAEPTASSQAYSSPITLGATTTVRAKAFKSGMTASATTTVKYTVAVATPSLSPGAGSYVDSVRVTIATSTSGATIRYTTNNQEPTTTSSVYSGALTFSSATTLKAKAFKSGMADSATASATYAIVKRVAAPVFDPAPGTFTGSARVTLKTATVGATIKITTNNSEPAMSSTTYSSPLNLSSTTTIKAKAFKTGMADSATVSATYTIHPPVVESVKFVAVDNVLDTNPNTGRGLRVFPEARSAADTVERRTVRVWAKVSPARSGQTVHFRVFDLDDPSDRDIAYRTGRTSPATDLDRNAAQGNDNRADGTSTPAGGSLSAASAQTDISGNASVVLTVSRQPGNNFAVTASLDAGYSSGLRLRSSDGSVIEDAAGTKLPTAKAVRTEMLTTWRTLHAEVDRMGNVGGNVVRGRIVAVSPGTSTTSVTIENLPAPGAAGIDGLENRFHNGRFRIGTGAWMTVRSNTANTTGNDIIVVNGVLPRTAVGSSYELEDDDHLRFAEGSPLINVDTSRLVEYFRQAYIEVVFDLANPSPLATFRANSGTHNGTLASEYRYDSRRAASPHFWQIYILGAFQGYETADADPDTGTATMGQVDAIGSPGTGAHIFLEAIRDFRHTEFETVVHEVGHLLGGEHVDLGMMAQSVSPEHSTAWTNVSLHKFRTLQRR